MNRDSKRLLPVVIRPELALNDQEFHLLKLQTAPRNHQVDGTEALLSNPFFALFDEMGAGKTKQAIDAAQMLFIRGLIDNVIVVCPAPVRSVWVEPELGEITKHGWKTLRHDVWEFHSKGVKWAKALSETSPGLNWTVTNFDYMRNEERLEELLRHAGPHTFLIVDESSAVKTPKSLQTKAVTRLRNRCGRVVLLNGTPISNNTLDLYSQCQIMSPSILECKSFTHFKARYCVMGGYLNKEVLSFKNLDDLQRRMAPYVLRRLKKDCLDLPEKLEPVILTVPLSAPTWTIYKQMRDEFIAELTDGTIATAKHAATKALRLSQITSGFVGGIESELQEDDTAPVVIHPPKEISSEKMDLFLSWFQSQLDRDPNFKIVVWSRFRSEVLRLSLALKERIGLEVGTLLGGQHPGERARALRLLDPRTAPSGPVVVVGTVQTGSMGLNLTAASDSLYLSNSYSHKDRLQSEDRIHRPGQINRTGYFDVVATGPRGERTIDRIVLKALSDKADLATLTTSAWLKVLQE